MEIYILVMIFGAIPAAIAYSKGENFFTWWIYGSLLFIVALPHALLKKPHQKVIEEQQLSSGEMKKCPFCAETIKKEATVCKFCSRELIKTVQQKNKYTPQNRVCPHCLQTVPNKEKCSECDKPLELANY